jgi:glutamate-1-semialdehyde 2,1-aminomutase
MATSMIEPWSMVALASFKKAYAALPLSPQTRLRIRSRLFTAFPRLFQGTTAYDEWHAYLTRVRQVGPEHHAGGSVGPGSRRQYGVRYLHHDVPQRLSAAVASSACVTLVNDGDQSWRASPSVGGPAYLMVTCDGVPVAYRPLPCSEVAPGESVAFHFPLLVDRPGQRTLRIEMVEDGFAPFSDRGVPPLLLTVTVGAQPSTASAAAYAVAARCNPWFFQPSDGIAESRDGRPYPLFVTRAKGCALWDPEGHEYLDYVMAYGAALLGYADDRVQDAIASVVHTAALTPFPHPLEMDVSRMLCETFPSAEMVIFGKNGSDVCTVAARLARAFTGKSTILHCGYHGWQDFWVEQWGFHVCGVPERPEPLIYGFKFNDRAGFLELLRTHRASLAAVMLEPSGPWAGDAVGLEPDIDQDFLETLAGATRDAGALLIFDEIITGFRYPQGSVQRARGVTPDLTCLGKALASGMPLSALVGRADVFRRGLPRAHYSPTFKAEVYSFAAAKATLDVYRREPVSNHVWDFGRRLAHGIDQHCRALGVRAGCTGPPFRFTLTFSEARADRRRAMRSLYHQELLKQGLVTHGGVMLPSYAHDSAVLDRTLAAVEHSLQVVATADREDAFDRYLELPLLP